MVDLTLRFENPTLFYVGAEAEVYRAKWYGIDVVIKRRIPKPYRIRELDEEIRFRRTMREAKILHYAKKAGVPTPTVYFLDPTNSTIIMNFIEGERTREALSKFTGEERVRKIELIGVYTGRLHQAGIQHGDLTTSNMILTEDGRIFIVDFGLGAFTNEVEDMAVDLILFRRALMSTHYMFAEECFKAFLRGYASIRGRKIADKVLDKAREVEKRGRYVIRS
ncbi:Kae1-associated kinase Bud32 [Candidatus Bathyarchaeota archaeon]|nr:Kae1-associated kinase Bud32 [Candidatus Bathyarchaeota archaeon]